MKKLECKTFLWVFRLQTPSYWLDSEKHCFGVFFGALLTVYGRWVDNIENSFSLVKTFKF